jgi:Ni,Fe-hydrogenase III large subunit/Ni,Fe-hydrogenase III component G
MDYQHIIEDFRKNVAAYPISVNLVYPDEVYIGIHHSDFNKMCLWLHKLLRSPVAMFFAVDERKTTQAFALYCAFMSAEFQKWFFVRVQLLEESPFFNSISKEIYSAHLFEREIKEMFGIEPLGNPDTRRLNLHDEVWPEGFYPLRGDFNNLAQPKAEKKEYTFKRVEGEGVFEVPVGPVHAGIIGPGHFRFSVAGEPIINLEIRLGFTHRGVEKIFEGKDVFKAVGLSERVCGDAAFAHSLAFCQAVEKIGNTRVLEQHLYLRGIFLELERIYNHAADIGGIAIDAGFSYPAMYASVIKERVLQLNADLTGSRYLKGINAIGGVSKELDSGSRDKLLITLESIRKDFVNLKEMLYSSVSFMDRVDDTGVLRNKTAEDLGVVGLAARASGISLDLRKNFPGIYGKVNFKLVKQEKGDVLARLTVRIEEFIESVELIKQFVSKLQSSKAQALSKVQIKEGFALGYVEGWRGPVLYWLKIDESGLIKRCKIVDASFHNWQGLSYAVLGNIIPDFPLCNKSFNLSYTGNDL